MARRHLLTSLAAAAALAVPGSAAAAPIAGHGQASPSDALGYWTPERMEDAVPLDGPGSPATIADPTASAAAQPPDVEIDPARDVLYPERVHGKLFLNLGGQNSSCSGTVVNSRAGNLVLTAGHCVVEPGINGAEPSWATNVIFVPAFRYGAMPFGAYPAVRLRAPLRWARDPLAEFDLGAVSLAPGPGGARIQDLLGARGVGFSRPPGAYRRKRFQIFGYPGQPAAFYDAQRPVLCRSPFVGFERFTGSVVAGPCNMKQGSSGGGFVLPGGIVNSVVSHGTCPPATALTCTRTAGTYFGPTAFKLYTAAGGLAPGKRKALKRCKKKQRKARIKCRVRTQTFRPVVQP